MLQMTNVEVYYGSVRALDSVTLHVDEGELVTLIGSNGAGKSTVLKTVSGLTSPRVGTIEFLNQRIDDMSPTEIVRLGIVHCPEGRRVFPDMTVGENLDMGAYTRSDTDDIATDRDRLLERFPILHGRQHQRAGDLSGGQQQMLAIARAVLAQPRLLMLDEPSLGLAPILVEQVADIIRELHASGTTILLNEQNAEMALRLADRTYVLETGRVTLEGASEDLLQNEHVRKSYLGD
ncbi:MAG TPA: branched-chain amino acid ABC transporter ATP-binding protein [Acidobacteria bacterium]|uniref:ABC transporter domain-containing protein n=1 Tax=marine metagenome TaxID=408172 RepID=A0A382K641_9ZZZZ|nr:branched-chain amino acid ABC transporter ATP-binding protein [Acidobacteriota bacterium]|tara:strand:+ start:457 stop:1161 length:705 start_codon:yes stop_codon:yes gene_type:complete